MATMNPDRPIEKIPNHPLPVHRPGSHHHPGHPLFDPAIHGPYISPHPMLGMRK